ncbi:phosphate ABC transporter permease subunit PstC [Halomarina oriensis]|uniref:Phosphate transport system permease protein n=1 Tax=Halomarina oriensis TaxID=671145 RepID=A0A6B0GLT1_9EURY|nr:phosphate ABC transporter permease subunit PstC [Halomarina oriensis]MWG34851.1 phosphate ABC transporter permease subunit PstC [Halomarina oriensis]
MGADNLDDSLTTQTENSPRELLARSFFFVCAFVSILTTVGIVFVLVTEATTFFSETAGLRGVTGPTVSIVDFLTGTEFSIASEQFGVLPLLSGTLAIVVGAAVIALPLGVATAIYLSEYADPQTRKYLKPALEILAGVPTVIYGYFAVEYITPLLERYLFPDIGFFNALSASIVVGIMIIPMVSSISEDAMSAVPDDLREAGYGMGATKFDVSTGIVVPAAISGIFSSFILAISRAIGETMAVTIAAGASPKLVEFGTVGAGPVSVPYPDPAYFLEPIQTMTSAMVQLLFSDITGGGVAYRSLFGIGITLFVITLIMNVLSDWVASRYQEDYD